MIKLFNKTGGGLWSRFLLLAAVLLSAGCGGGGSDSGDFVVDGGGNPSQAGGLTFQFVRAQSTLAVPIHTSNLRFEFFTGTDGTGQSSQPTQTLGFATTITINPVFSSTRSVVVTALTSAGVPLVRGVADVTVASGQNTAVVFDLSEAVEVTRVELTPASTSVTAGATQQYRTRVTFDNGAVVESPAGVVYSATGATIDAATGLATAGPTAGVATITAAYSGVSGTATLTVQSALPVLTSLQVTPDQENVGIGGSKQFFVAGFDQNSEPYSLDGLNIVWSSTANLSINASSGLAIGVSSGSATVTATLDDLSDSATVNVFQPDLDGIVSVAPSPVLLTYMSTSATLVTVGSFGTSADRVLTNADSLNYFISGPSGVASVSTEGVVSPIAVGNTVVTVSAGTFSSVVEVRVGFGTGGNQTPQITLASTEAIFRQDSDAFPFAGAAVQDDQAYLDGGTLVIGQDASQTDDVSLFAPTSPDIGEVVGSGTATLRVNLDASASPSRIAEFLQSVVARSSSSASLGEGAFEIALDDGEGREGDGFREFLVLGPGALQLTVNTGQAVSATNFHSIINAVTAVRQQSGTAFGSLITATVGDFSAEGRIFISSDSDLRGLVLRGANAGNPIGVRPFGQPATATLGTTEISRFQVDGDEVTVDGFFSNEPTTDVIALTVTGNSIRALNNHFRRDGAQSGVGIYTFEAGGEIVLKDNRLENFVSGIQVTNSVAGTRLHIASNLIKDNRAGMQLLRCPVDLEVKGNCFTNSSLRHLEVDLAGNSVEGFTNNDLAGGRISVYSNTLATFGATNNWWGQSTGPASQIGQRDALVTSTPFSTAPNTNYP